MFTVGVREHVMIAHSFTGDVFGPAQNLHGATFVVDVEFRAQALSEAGIVIDIARAHSTLRRILSEFNYKNLDELAVFKGKNTTTEFLARFIFQQLASATNAEGELGPGAEDLDSIKVSLHESHVAWAAFEGTV